MSAEGACWMTELRCTGKVLKIDGTGRRRWVRSPAARGIQIRRCAVSAAAALGGSVRKAAATEARPCLRRLGALPDRRGTSYNPR